MVGVLVQRPLCHVETAHLSQRYLTCHRHTLDSRPESDRTSIALSADDVYPCLVTWKGVSKWLCGLINHV